VDHLEDSLKSSGVLMRMYLTDVGESCHNLVDAWVVLHCARSEEADTHHPEGLLRQVEIVA
jgi:hypothetical protein